MAKAIHPMQEWETGNMGGSPQPMARNRKKSSKPEEPKAVGGTGGIRGCRLRQVRRQIYGMKEQPGTYKGEF